MEINDIVCLGDRVDLIDLEKGQDDNEDKNFYISKVYDINEDGQLEIFMPMEKLKTILLSKGSEYLIYIYAKKGIFTCNVIVYERYKTESTMIAVLELTSDIKKHQRREYYRYDCVIGMNCSLLNEDETAFYIDKKDTSFLPEPTDKGVIVDISGGGMRFVSPFKYESGSLVLCRYILKNDNETKTYNNIIRILSSYSVVNNPKNTEYRGQFLFISNKEREEIIKYIFAQERKMRKKR